MGEGRAVASWRGEFAVAQEWLPWLHGGVGRAPWLRPVSYDVPAEMTVCGLVIQYWNPPVSIGGWITVSGVVMVALNCLPVRFYGETEFCMSCAWSCLMLRR